MACGPDLLSQFPVYCMIWCVTQELWSVLHNEVFKCNLQLYLSSSALNHFIHICANDVSVTITGHSLSLCDAFQEFYTVRTFVAVGTFHTQHVSVFYWVIKVAEVLQDQKYYVTPDHKSSHKSHKYICSNSQILNYQFLCLKTE